MSSSAHVLALVKHPFPAVLQQGPQELKVMLQLEAELT
jgi:hypothetical protein